MHADIMHAGTIHAVTVNVRLIFAPAMVRLVFLVVCFMTFLDEFCPFLGCFFMLKIK